MPQGLNSQGEGLARVRLRMIHALHWRAIVGGAHQQAGGRHPVTAGAVQYRWGGADLAGGGRLSCAGDLQVECWARRACLCKGCHCWAQTDTCACHRPDAVAEEIARIHNGTAALDLSDAMFAELQKKQAEMEAIKVPHAPGCRVFCMATSPRTLCLPPCLCSNPKP